VQHFGVHTLPVCSLVHIFVNILLAKFLRHLLGITKLNKNKRINVLGKKNGSTEHSKGNKTVPEKVATTCTEDGHKQTTKTSTTI